MDTGLGRAATRVDAAPSPGSPAIRLPIVASIRWSCAVLWQSYITSAFVLEEGWRLELAEVARLSEGVGQGPHVVVDRVEIRVESLTPPTMGASTSALGPASSATPAASFLSFQGSTRMTLIP
jgi:hypothetical protein